MLQELDVRNNQIADVASIAHLASATPLLERLSLGGNDGLPVTPAGHSTPQRARCRSAQMCCCACRV